MNDWTITLQDSCSVTIVRKAFDTVSHSRLIARLASYGIRGNLLSWVQEYHCGRSHCSRIGVAYSMLACMLSGIIQGSVTGPLLFLIFLNDLVELLASVGITVMDFADDMNIYLLFIYLRNKCSTIHTC